MVLQSTAQELFVIDPTSSASQLAVEDTDAALDVALPLFVEETAPQSLEVAEPVDVEIVIEDLPGAPPGTKDPEPPLEVAEEPSLKVDEKQSVDDNEAKKSKKNEKWDWESKGPHGFIAWIKERIDTVPRHSGYDSAGLERAVAYLEKLDGEISKAMRLDLDEELDANKIEEVRAQIDDGIARLHARLDKVKKNKKSSRKKKAEDELSAVGFVKEAQKITGVAGIYIVAPLFISRLARVCINGMVSGGHDIEDMYRRQAAMWNLTSREKAELQQLLFDMGYPMIQDRGFLAEEQLEITDSNGMDYAANFRG